MRYQPRRLSVSVRTFVPAVILGVGTLVGGNQAHAVDPLIAESDLPGIPISVTQGARRQVTESPTPVEQNDETNDPGAAARSAIAPAVEARPTARAPEEDARPAVAGVDPDEPVYDPTSGRVDIERLRQSYGLDDTPAKEPERNVSRAEPGVSDLDIAEPDPERPSMLDEDLNRIGETLARSMATAVTKKADDRKADPEKPKGPTTLTLIPGVNQLATISRGHPNRVVTPFTHPEIRTTASGAEITTTNSVVYIATNDEGPVTLYISEKGEPRLAASLTLVPQPIPPQEIVFNFTDEITRKFKVANPRAEDWETRQPYVDTLVDLFKALASQDLPSGYSLRKPHGSDVITCFGGQHVAFELGQVVEGHNIEVQVLRATNVSDVTVEVIGHQCSGEAVMAAAEWPYSILEPGASTEMYVAKHRLERITPDIRRPSLIGDTQ